MKFTIETDDEYDAKALFQAKAAALTLWEIAQMLRRHEKYGDGSEETIKIRSDFYEIIEENGVTLELYP